MKNNIFRIGFVLLFMFFPSIIAFAETYSDKSNASSMTNEQGAFYYGTSNGVYEIYRESAISSIDFYLLDRSTGEKRKILGNATNIPFKENRYILSLSNLYDLQTGQNIPLELESTEKTGRNVHVLEWGATQKEEKYIHMQCRNLEISYHAPTNQYILTGAILCKPRQ